MREIKFRAWLKGADVMYWHKDLAAYTFVLFTERGSFELMQYTGLKDKNGKEIYEGDIIRFCPKPGSCGIIYSINGENAMVRKVVWLDDDAQFGWELPSGSRNQSGYMFHRCSEDIFEVIGNIYEGLYSGEHCDILKVWNGNTERQSQGRSKDTGLLKKQSGKSG